MNYLWHLVTLLSTYGIVALGLNLMAGYCGRLSLAQASFFGIGAYTYALLSLSTNLGFVPTALVAMTLATALSLLISLPAARFRQDFFVILSLAIQALLFGTLYNWSSEGHNPGTWSNMTNGPFGLSGIPKPRLAWIVMNDMPSMALFASACLAIVAFICQRLTSSPWGRLLKAVRDDEVVLAGLGKNVRLAEISAFAFGCGFAALAGAVYAGYMTYIDPSVATLDHSILMLSMVIVGGTGNFVGPLVGAFALVLVPEALRFLSLPVSPSPPMPAHLIRGSFGRYGSSTAPGVSRGLPLGVANVRIQPRRP